MCVDLPLMLILSVVCQADDGTIVDMRTNDDGQQQQLGLFSIQAKALAIQISKQPQQQTTSPPQEITTTTTMIIIIMILVCHIAT